MVLLPASVGCTDFRKAVPDVIAVLPVAVGKHVALHVIGIQAPDVFLRAVVPEACYVVYRQAVACIITVGFLTPFSISLACPVP